MAETYKVIYPFLDKKDKNKKIYKIGDEYVGSKTSERLNELLSIDNAAGTPLIRKSVEVKKGENKDGGK